MNNQIDELIDLIDKTRICLGEDYLADVVRDKNIKRKDNNDISKSSIKLQQMISELKVEKKEEKKEINIFQTTSNSLNSYQELNDIVKNCSKCPASTIRRQSIFGKGDLYPKLMVIGEGPGKDEDFQNDLFVGKSGQYLERWLNAINLDFKKDIYFTNVVKCFSNSNPTKEMVDTCLPYLKQQIELIEPKTILVLGKIAANALLENELPLKDMRGKITLYQRIPTIVTYHPAAVLRNLNWRKPVWEDLQKLEKLINI